MNNEKTKPESDLGEMHKRRETMADGRRYIIYYTFSEAQPSPNETKESEAQKNV